MKIDPFEVEQWMDEYETKCRYNIAETCCASVSITSLLSMSPTPIDPLTLLAPATIQNYGHIRGSPDLLANLAEFYSSDPESPFPLPTENILITPGAIAANFLVLYSLVGPGDHVICHHPTYQQLYSVPAALGAEVNLWKAKAENRWLPDIEELKAMIRPNTKLIIINNPNNPTGVVLPQSLLTGIIQLASKTSIPILSDEVYRPLFHSLPPTTKPPPSILSLSYPLTIATGSLSKAFSLAGIRTGWIATRSRELTERFASARDYTCISVSQVDQAIAATALSADIRPRLLDRNIELARTNLAVLDKFVRHHKDVCNWVKPVAGTTAFVRFRKRDGTPVNAVKFCKRVLEETGVLFLPGDKGFGEEFEGYVRIGYVPEADVMEEGFGALEGFMEKGLDGL